MSAAGGVLRAGLLEGREVVMAGAARGGVRERIEALGGRVVESPGESPASLVHDARRGFGDGGREGLARAMAEVWAAVQPLAAQAMIPAGRGGRIVVIAPPSGAGGFASAAAAGLENLARTLSIEWARYAITAVCVIPADETGEEDLAEVVAYLLSRAGGYFSGCALSLA